MARFRVWLAARGERVADQEPVKRHINFVDAKGHGARRFAGKGLSTTASSAVSREIGHTEGGLCIRIQNYLCTYIHTQSRLAVLSSDFRDVGRAGIHTRYLINELEISVLREGKFFVEAYHVMFSTRSSITSGIPVLARNARIPKAPNRSRCEGGWVGEGRPH